MKIITSTFILCSVLLLSYSSFACSSEKADFSADGLSILMGIYSPLHSEMKGIYGGAFTISGQYCLNMSESVDLLASIGFINKEGNPYYNDPTFSSGDPSKLSIIPMEFSIRKRITLTRDESDSRSRGFHLGGGINYVRASEKIPNIMSASGGDFGLQIFAGPQIFFREDLAFEGDIKLLMNEVDMKSDENRYSITLSGVILRVALSWYY